MKKLFLFVLVSSFFLTGFVAQAQTCLIIRDSIIAGNRVSTFSDYIYGTNDRLDQVTHTDSGSLVVTTSDLTLYTGNDLSEIRTFNTVGPSIVTRRINYTYANGKISRVAVMDSSNGLWQVAHDITYNGNEIASIDVDASSIVGSPDMIQQASFIDFVWSNGNITSLSLLLGIDTIEVATTTDTGNNLFKDLLNTEGVTYLFQAASLNNFVTVALVNDEPGIGQSQGAKILDRVFTYNGDNDVETMEEKATPLNPEARTIQYIYDCSVGIRAPQAVSAISLYPNPAQNVISMENGNFKGAVKIFNVAGKQVFSGMMDGEATTLDISNLVSGMYSLEMVDGGKIFRGKFLVNQ